MSKIKKPTVSLLAALMLLATTVFASASLAAGGGWGQQEGSKPGCAFGAKDYHWGPPGKMAQGGFEDGQGQYHNTPAERESRNSCPGTAGGGNR